MIRPSSRVASFAAGLILLLASSEASADELCTRLKPFEAARFDGIEQPKGRRWVELHWVGRWLDLKNGWGFNCLSSGDEGAKKLCSWLVDHSPSEFSTYLPIGILECYGYQFPKPYDEWANWRSDIQLSGYKRQLLLEVNFLGFEGESGAIRLSAFADNVFNATAPLPPMGALKAEK
jgi:hypothetical protein